MIFYVNNIVTIILCNFYNFTIVLNIISSHHII